MWEVGGGWWEVGGGRWDGRCVEEVAGGGFRMGTICMESKKSGMRGILTLKTGHKLTEI